MEKVYVVRMIRFGDRERHSYVLGAFDVLQDAKDIAEEETTNRGGKYDYEILECLYRNVNMVVDTCPEFI